MVLLGGLRGGAAYVVYPAIMSKVSLVQQGIHMLAHEVLSANSDDAANVAEVTMQAIRNKRHKGGQDALGMLPLSANYPRSP